MIFIKIDHYLRHKAAPKFWRNFNEPRREVVVDSGVNENFYKFQSAVYNLYEDYDRCISILNTLSKFKSNSIIFKDVAKKPNDKIEFNRMFRCSLLSQLPDDFNKLVYDFYDVAFKVFASDNGKN